MLRLKKQVYNPYLPNYEYIPDGEPHIFGDRVYVYGSHDRFDGNKFCLLDYVCYSAPVDDLSDWRYEGVIFSKKNDPHRMDGEGRMAAPDCVQGKDGRFYFYYFGSATMQHMSVAVCDSPAGKFEYLGDVRYQDGTPIGKAGDPCVFDPGVFIDDDGKIYLYHSFAMTTNPFVSKGRKMTINGPVCFELEDDMLTVKKGPTYIGVAPRNSFATMYEGHEFLEASSMRKFDGKYYFIYSSQLSHELCYAVSDYPDRDFSYGGTLISNGDIGLYGYDTRHAANFTGNTHGSLIKIKDKFYVFYHRQTNRNQYSRQACAEEIVFHNGKFYQAEMTSCGLNGGPLEGDGTYSTSIACNLRSRFGSRFYIAFKLFQWVEPCLTQSGTDREENPDQYIQNMCNGAMAGFKYFDLSKTKNISVFVKGKAKGILEVRDKYDQYAEPIATIPIEVQNSPSNFKAKFTGPLKSKSGLYFTFRGTGHFDFYSFTLI